MHGPFAVTVTGSPEEAVGLTLNVDPYTAGVFGCAKVIVCDCWGGAARKQIPVLLAASADPSTAFTWSLVTTVVVVPPVLVPASALTDE